MHRKKLDKIKSDLRSLKAAAGNLRDRRVREVARSLGRRRCKGGSKRGKEPTFISEPFPDLRPLSIPAHGTLKKGTGLNILNQLDEDVLRWEEELESNQPEE